MRGARVCVEQLSKRFGDVEALRPLDLQIEPGELVALLGPSGCGKTTTLLLLAGIYKPTRGVILFDDERVDRAHPRERDIGMVFQSYALYPHLSLFENIAFPLRLKRIPRRDVERRVREVAELLGIASELGRKPEHVSGGQQQRAALARALVKEPHVLLLDEPLSNLDASVRLRARAEIRRVQRELGVTTILVTHDQSEALAMADRVAVLAGGELQQYADPAELYSTPRNTFVASFVGHPPMNLVEGRVTDGTLHAGDLVFPIPVPRDAVEVQVGIRPEDVRVGTNERRAGRADVRGGEPTLEGRVRLVEPLGRELLLTLEIGSTPIQALCPAENPVTPGDTVSLGFPVARLHFFRRNGVRVDV